MVKKKATKKTISTVKKTQPKQKAVKKTVSKKTQTKNAPKQHYFVRCDGVEIKSILDLAKQLDEMADDIFYHHVTYDRNDFATWVQDIFKEIELAEQLGANKNKKDCCYVVMKHVIGKK